MGHVTVSQGITGISATQLALVGALEIMVSVRKTVHVIVMLGSLEMTAAWNAVYETGGQL